MAGVQPILTRQGSPVRLPVPRSSVAEPFGRAPGVWKRKAPRWAVIAVVSVFFAFVLLFLIGGMG